MKKTGDKALEGFTDEERAAMKARVREMKAEASGKKADGEADVVSAIAAMPEPSRSMGERLHALIRSAAPMLTPRTWYGMPAYSKDGKVLMFFRGAEKFKERYLTLGFQDNATLDEGSFWPIAFALTKLGPAEEKRITELVKKAVGAGD